MRGVGYITRAVTEVEDVKLNYHGEYGKYMFKKYAEAPNNKKTK